MPRRSGGMRSTPSRGFSSPPAPAANLPARAPPSQVAPPAATQPRQPGMFAQMATTAAGVAVGSAVGHTLGAAMVGGMSGGGSQEAAPAQPQDQQMMYQQQPMYSQQQQPQPGGPCAAQLQQFLQCTQTQADITLCQGFNEALRECKLTYGMPLQ